MKESTKQFLCNVYGEFHREMLSCKDELENLDRIAKEEGLWFTTNSPATGSFKLVKSELLKIGV